MQLEIRERRPNVEVEVVSPPKWFAKTGLRPVLALLWEQIVLPFRTRGGILLSLCNTGPVMKRRQVIVFHDAAVFDMPQNYNKSYVRLHKKMMTMHARRAARVLTTSRFSMQRLTMWLGLRESAIGFVGMGVEHILTAEADDTILNRLGVNKRQYIVAIGSRQPGKNFGALLEAAAIAKLSTPVVVVGGKDVHVFGMGPIDRSEYLVEAGYVTDGELVALLQNASCYVQPSLYEGFGLPVIEAMALGVPVLCARAGSLPEICGSAAILFDPRDPVDIAKAITDFLADEHLYQSMSQAGTEHARSHVWRSSAAHLLDTVLQLDE